MRATNRQQALRRKGQAWHSLRIIMPMLLVTFATAALAAQRPVTMIELRNAINRSAGHNPKLNTALLAHVSNAERQLSTDNATQASITLNSLRTEVLRSPLSAAQKNAILTELELSRQRYAGHVFVRVGEKWRTCGGFCDLHQDSTAQNEWCVSAAKGEACGANSGCGCEMFDTKGETDKTKWVHIEARKVPLNSGYKCVCVKPE